MKFSFTVFEHFCNASAAAVTATTGAIVMDGDASSSITSSPCSTIPTNTAPIITTTTTITTTVTRATCSLARGGVCLLVSYLQRYTAAACATTATVATPATTTHTTSTSSVSAEVGIAKKSQCA